MKKKISNDSLKGKKLFKEYEKLDTRGKIAFKQSYYRSEKIEELRRFEERALIAQNIQQSLTDKEGRPYLDADWIAKNILKLTDKEILENRKNRNEIPSGTNFGNKLEDLPE